MIDRLLERLMQMDEQQAQRLLERLDKEKALEGLDQLADLYVGPHLHDVRDNVQSYPDPREVRETYKSLSDERQQEMFDEAMDEVIVTAKLIRHRPEEGLMKLKSILRDPTTVEALLLIFENEHIDEEYRGQLKDFAAMRLHEIGVMALPEMYHEQEARSVLQRFDPNHGQKARR